MNSNILQRAIEAHKAGNFAEAARLYADILRADPRNFPALFSLGFLHYQVGRFEDAQRILADALRLNPRSPEALFTRGAALQRLSRLQEALSSFDQALAVKPDFVEAQSSRGMALMMLNRNEEALQSLDIALAFDSRNASAWNDRGRILQAMGRYDEAIQSFAKAIARDSTLAEATLNRAATFAAMKRYEDAASDLEAALKRDPEIPYSRGHLCLYRISVCDWRHYQEDVAAIAAGLRSGKRVVNPFINVLISSSLADQLQCARIWTASEAPPSPNPLWRGERYAHQRIRIGYVSADFHSHATPALMAGVFEAHDKARFETIAFSFGPDDRSTMRTRVMAAFDRFIDVRGRSDADIAKLMRQMEIDIAVDLKGHTKDSRSGIFAHRPAPIQASYLGYPGTMGAPYIDYILADRVVLPSEHRPYYTEQIAWLPDTYQCNDSKRLLTIGGPSRAEAGLPEDCFVFCCFNNNFKIAPSMFAIWMRLLKAIPESVLWLLEDSPEAMRNLRLEAKAHGVAPERLIPARRVSAAEHLARHRLADLFLDTQPYGAHTTASDALWMGLPVLTALGPTFAGRVAASLLHAAGLPELIAPSLDAYEAMALDFARNASALADVKAKLAVNRASAPLFDTLRFTRNLESAYLDMWQRGQRGEPPRSFAVSTSPQVPPAAAAAFVEGCQLAQDGFTDDAMAALERAIAIAPRFPEALTNLGALLQQKKRPEDALKRFDAALAVNAGIVQAWNNRGNALSELGRFDEAVASYDKALALMPDLFEGQLNRGSALLSARREEEALSSYESALRLNPGSIDAVKGRANALFALKRYEDSVAGFEAVLARDPNHAYARGDLAFAKLQCCDWRGWEADRSDIAAAVAHGRRVVNPFAFIALSGDPAAQKRCAAIWTTHKHPPSPRPLWRGEGYGHERIRIAYLSADFRTHPVAQAIAGVLEHHDRARFEIIGMSCGPDDGSPIRARLMRAFDRFIDVDKETDQRAARTLRDVEADIVVDLSGFTADARPSILAARPAPIQVNYLGFPGTMGAAYADYLIADTITVPDDARDYSETVIRLPDTYFPVDSTRVAIGAAPSRREAGLPAEGIVFAAFNNSFKFSAPMFDIWMRLLKETGGSVLWLSSMADAAQRNLAREAKARGVDPDRLILAPYAPAPEAHLARLSLADLFLDTLPYNAHATAADALLAGVPVLTCKGTSFAGRVAASLLHASGMPELVTESLAAYEALALGLARDADSLAALKAKLAQSRATAPLFDTARYTRNLENAYLEMHARR